MMILVDAQERLTRFVPIQLKPDLSNLSESERQIIPLLLEAADAMEAPFWIQNYGDRDSLLASISDADEKRYVRENYGPWDRHHHNEPIISGVGGRPLGANFYPGEMTRNEFESAAANDPALKSPFTMVRRDNGGDLVAIPYHQFFQKHVRFAATKLRQAAKLSSSQDLRRYFMLRAEALLTDDYRASDIAWMEMKDNTLDMLIGPMEIEDRLLGIKTAYSASILIKQWDASQRLSQYTKLLPQFQETLPVPAPYKAERPGLESGLQIYETLKFAGLDAFDKPRGVAWPADEEVQQHYGVRSLLLKDMIEAKYEAFLLPVADLMIAGDQRHYVQSEAHLNFVMLHELAHGLGLRYTLDDRKPVREALGELWHTIEEAKANTLCLDIASQLRSRGMMDESDLAALFVTSLVALLDNYGSRQSIVQLNYFAEMGAYSRNSGTDTYRIHRENMPTAIESFAGKLLRLQGDGDYDGALEFLEQYGEPDEALERDIDRLESAGLPLGILLE